MLEDAEISRILSITAHPDDVDFAAAGTVARWTEAGIEVVYCLVTDGDAGGFDEDFPRAEIPAVRRAEQAAGIRVAETGWTMWMVSHFHYDPVWWDTQGEFTESRLLLPGEDGSLPDVRSAFELVGAQRIGRFQKDNFNAFGRVQRR